MSNDPMFWLATGAFAWGLSLASYRWFAVYNHWPMGEWQAHRPGLPIAIGVFCMLFAMVFAIARGGGTVVAVPLIGFACALGWTVILRVGAQSSLVLAPLSVVLLLALWMVAASDRARHSDASVMRPTADALIQPAATERDPGALRRDHGITTSPPRVLPPLQR